MQSFFAPDVRVTQPMFDAYVSLLFNLGRDKVKDTWKVFENTRKGNYRAAAPEFLNIDKVTNPVTGKKSAVTGLTTRRKRESLLFLNGTY